MSLSDKVAVCVGSTNGIGRGVALALAKRGASVVIIGRNPTAGESVLESVRQLSPNGKHELILTDTSLLSNVKQISQRIQHKYSKIDYLILTQGTGSFKGRNETNEGHDEKLVGNFYGRMAMIANLLPTLQSSSNLNENQDVRVLSVLSGGVHGSYTNIDDLPLKNNFSIQNAANAAGVYTDIALDSFHQDPKNSKITFIHLAPGLVNTEYSRDMPWYIRYPLKGLMQIIGQSLEDSGEYITNRALLDENIRGGFRIINPKGNLATPVPEHSNKDFFNAVWKHTCDVIGYHPQ